jgi:hypothetical protein
MKSIQKEQILRVNCPGFGEENYLTVGKAKPLDAYKTIIVNPVSVFHLFDRDLDLQREIDVKLGDGLTNLTIPSDTILQSIQEDLKSKRILELVSFLEKGGLLIYYLCRPFLVQGDNVAIDNYSWLESLAPDSSPDDNIRHMSAVSHGRIVEPTEHTEESGFAKYLNQSGIEWNTIIRTDFLTEGYIALATAGPRKCIAGQLVAGDQGGRIIFLPAPYSPDFDKTLIECVNIWYNQGEVDTTSVAVAAPVEAAAKPATPSQPAPPQTPQPAAAATPPAAPQPVVQATQPAAPAAASPRASSTSNAAVQPLPRKSAAPAAAEAPSVAPAATPPISPGTISSGGVERVPSQFTNSSSQSKMPAAKLPDEDSHPSTAATSTILPAMSQGALGDFQPSNPQVTAEFDAEAVRAFLASDQSITGPQGKGIEVSETVSGSADQKPSAVDILKELEALSLGEAEAPPAKAAEPAAALNRNLFEELETLAQTVPSDKVEPKAPAPAPVATPAPTATPTPAAPAAPPEAKAPAPEPIKADVKAAPEINLAQLLVDQAESKPATASAPEPAKAEPAEPESKATVKAEIPEPPATPSTPTAEAPASEASAAEAPAAAGQSNFTPEQNFDTSFQFESDFTFTDLEKEFSNQPKQAPVNNKEETAAPQPPEAKDLIKKMEEISKTTVSNDWAGDVTFPDVEELKKERAALTESIKQAQTKIASIDNKITQLDALKNALLGAEGGDLSNATVRVFNRLGWNAALSGKAGDEYHLNGGGKTEFIAKLIKSLTQAQRSDLSSLASSVVEFWDKNETEPKGILVACTWTSKAPGDRTEPDFADGLAEFAQKKGLCLMTTSQLLCMYRDIEMGKQTSDEIRKRIEETNGRLGGFQLITPMAKV